MSPKAKVISSPASVVIEECTGYCVKCKVSKNMLDCVKKVAKNGRSMLQGNCETCTTKMTKFTK